MNSSTFRHARRLVALLWPSLVLAADPSGAMEARLAQLRANPPALYAFLLRMPKGGDLHNHLTGAVYAESYLDAAAEDGLCANLRAGSLVAPNKNGGCGEGEVPAARSASDNTLRNALIDSFSMRGFVPGGIRPRSFLRRLRQIQRRQARTPRRLPGRFDPPGGGAE